jgi:hypothetical protein
MKPEGYLLNAPGGFFSSFSFTLFVVPVKLVPIRLGKRVGLL